jgi:Zn-finger nucleic acid-binding protein
MPYRTAAEDTDEPAPDPRGPWVLQTWTSRRECPDCGVHLFAAKKEGFRVDACGQCGGAWLASAMLTRAVEERTIVPAMLSEMASKHAPAPRPNSPGRKCPDCQDALEARHVEKARVAIDVCGAHGAWFDADEMRRTIEALVKPPQVDPSVDRIIEEEAKRGAFRPPESYEVGYGFTGRANVALDATAVLLHLLNSRDPDKP